MKSFRVYMLYAPVSWRQSLQRSVMPNIVSYKLASYHQPQVLYKPVNSTASLLVKLGVTPLLTSERCQSSTNSGLQCLQHQTPGGVVNDEQLKSCFTSSYPTPNAPFNPLTTLYTLSVRTFYMIMCQMPSFEFGSKRIA